MTWIKVVLLVCVLNWASLEADGVVVDGMLSNAMEHMLNIEIPVRREREAASPPQPPPPLYMMDLYKKYLSSDSMKTRSNTIRSIVPIRGTFFHLKTIWKLIHPTSVNCYDQGPDLYAFIGFIGPDNDDLNWLLILIFDY